MNNKSISGAFKEQLLLKLKIIAEAENANYLENTKALSEAEDLILKKEYANECEYWQWQYALTSKLQEIVENTPTKDDKTIFKNVYSDENVSIWTQTIIKGGQ